MLSKKWHILPKISAKYQNRFAEMPEVLVQLLYNRGLKKQKEIDEFLNPNYENDIFDPFLLMDMKKAVDRILTAIDKDEKIVIYGDYDADGITSSALMTEVLLAVGLSKKNLDVFIPHREKYGYGLHHDLLEKIIKNKSSLVITVDCGITNKDEVTYAKDHGVDIIITDHHDEPLVLPLDAYAIIDPKLARENYPCRFLAGVGVAFKLAQALIQSTKIKIDKEVVEKKLLDLVALGTITDMVPLVSENHTLAKYGLAVLNKTKREGFLALLNVCGLISQTGEISNLDGYSAGFVLGPRINSAGRLKYASLSYILLITGDKEYAKKLAKELNSTNNERQGLVEKLMIKAEETIKDQIEKEKILIALGENWSIGLVGLVAVKIVEKYQRPILVLSLIDGQIQGSGRSVPAVNLIGLLKELDGYFAKYGGHPMACGLTLKNKDDFSIFATKIREKVNKLVDFADLLPVVEVDLELKLSAINWQLIADLEKMKPFGKGNPEPVFLLNNLEVVDFIYLGEKSRHLRLMVQSKDSKDSLPVVKKIIAFGLGEFANQLKVGEKIDCLCQLSVNEWNGNKEIQIKAVDLKKSV